MPTNASANIILPPLTPCMRAMLERAVPRAVLPSGSGTMRVKAVNDDVVDVLIYGPIGGSFFGEETVEAKAVVEALVNTRARTINVRINSHGGSCHDGVAIYNELRRRASLGTKIVVNVDGVAYSAASMIAMAGDEIVMPESALMMLHAPMGLLHVEGNALEVEEAANDMMNVLAAWGKALATTYARKTGKDASVFEDMWATGKDFFFTAPEAVEFGLCDRIVGTVDDDSEIQQDTGAMMQHLLALAPEKSALIRAAFDSHHPMNIGSRRGDTSMPEPEVNETQRQQVIAAERDRVSEIRAMAEPHITGRPERRDQYRAIMDRAIDDGVSAAEFGRRMLAVMAEGCGPLNGGAGVDTMTEGAPLQLGGRNSAFVQAASDVLAMRGNVAVDAPHPGVGQVRGMSISEIARACLPRATFDRGLSGPAAIRAALSTSDFPAILGDTIGKALRRGYEMEPGTHSAWVRRGTVPDFKEQTRVILGAMPDLLPVLEGGEYKHGSIDEDKSVPFRVEKFGRLIEVTWEMLVNDDLGALTRFPQGLGQAARRKEADLVYGLFDGSGQVMQDAKALFHSDHGNLATSSTDLDEAALAKGRLLMRKQTSVGGGALNLTPKFLLVPAEFEGQAEKILAASSIHVSAGLENATPEWIRRLQLIVESRLPADAAYLIADNNQVDTVELATLDDEGPAIGKSIGPHVTEEDGFDNDTKKFKVRLVAGARFLDWRGVVKLPIA